MDTLYSPDEVAALLGLEPDAIQAMAESGQLSGFTLDGEWRFARQALRADLLRMRDAIDPPEPLALAPLMSQQETLDDPAPRPEPVRASKHAHEAFSVNIHLDNDSKFSGEFEMHLLAEGRDDIWKNFKADECAVDDHELMVKSYLAPGQSLPIFSGSLEAKLGDRLFVTIPKQPGIDQPSEKVFVIDDDTDLKLTMTDVGPRNKKTVLRFKKL